MSTSCVKFEYKILWGVLHQPPLWQIILHAPATGYTCSGSYNLLKFGKHKNHLKLQHISHSPKEKSIKQQQKFFYFQNNSIFSVETKTIKENCIFLWYHLYKKRQHYLKMQTIYLFSSFKVYCNEYIYENLNMFAKDSMFQLRFAYQIWRFIHIQITV